MIYKINIALDPESAARLRASGNHLYVFQAVRNSDAAGQVLVWKDLEYGPGLITLEWCDNYAAYTTRSSQNPPENIAIYPIECGQSLNINSDGNGTIKSDGVAGKVIINNESQAQFTAGLAQAAPDQQAQPFCSFPLYGGGTQLMVPSPRVLLAFSTRPLQPGQAITSLVAGLHANAAQTTLFASSKGLLVDLAADDAPREVKFDINKSWSWGQYTWAQTVDATAPLATQLIQPDA